MARVQVQIVVSSVAENGEYKGRVIKGWESSFGASWEHDRAQELGIEIIYLDPNKKPQCGFLFGNYSISILITAIKSSINKSFSAAISAQNAFNSLFFPASFAYSFLILHNDRDS